MTAFILYECESWRLALNDKVISAASLFVACYMLVSCLAYSSRNDGEIFLRNLG
jgi:hypothetical protein